MNVNLLILCFHLFIIDCVRPQEKPSFRIIAPEFICSSATTTQSSNITSNATISSPPEITVQMLTRGGQVLKYSIYIFFEIIGGYKNQRHTLMIWRTIRTLEKKFRNETDMISIKNQINILNKDLTKGVAYTFTIVGSDENGVKSEAQNFTIVYKGEASVGFQENAGGSSINSEVSLVLLASVEAYVDNPYSVEAKLLFCKPIIDYFFKWQMTPPPQDNNQLTNIPGSILYIPPGKVLFGVQYDIEVKVFKYSNDKEQITGANMKLNLLNKQLSVELYPVYVELGVNRKVTFIIKSYNNDKLQITWQCKDSGSGEVCMNFVDSKTEMQTIQTSVAGDYEITAEISNDKKNRKLVGKIFVKPNIIASVKFKKLPSVTPSSGQPYELSAVILNLVPKCIAQWSIVKAEGFEYFDEKLLPNALGRIEVKDVDENFLSEIIDYGNDTINMAIKLTIPAKNQTINWLGLKGDAMYKFQLAITCPEPINDGDNMTTRGTVTSATDIVFHTNAAPQGLALEVIPLNGTALQTLFKFSTGIARDKDIDYPLKYTFYYQTLNHIISLNDNYENTVVETDLPYSKSPLTTFYQVCDSRDACAVFYGPNVTIYLNETIISSSITLKMEIIETHFRRFEFNDGFRKSFTLMLTLVHFKNQEAYNSTIKWMSELISKEIDVIKANQAEKKYYLPELQIIYFVQQAKGLIELIKPSNYYEITQELLKLFDATIASQKMLKSRVRRSFLSHPIRNLNPNTDYMKTVLELTAVLLKTDNETIVKLEQKQLVERIHKYLKQLCHNEDVTTETLDTKIVSLSFEKLFGQELSMKLKNIAIPWNNFPNNLKLQFNNLYELNGKSEYCLGRVYYPNDILDNTKDGLPIYEFVLWELDTETGESNNLEAIPTTSKSFVTTKIPANQNKTGFECTVWMDNQWSTKSCRKIKSNPNTNSQDCQCSSIGFFSLKEIVKDKQIYTTVKTETTGSSSGITTPLPMTTTATTRSISTPSSTTGTLKTTGATTTLAPVTPETTTITHQSKESSSEVEQSTRMSTVTERSTSLSPSVIYQTTPAFIFKPSQSFQPQVDPTVTQIPTNPTVVNTGHSNQAITSSAITIIANDKQTSNVASILGYFLIAFIVMSAFGYIIYRKCRKDNNASIEQMISELKPRESSKEIKYARFYDEHVMNGADVFFNNTNN